MGLALSHPDRVRTLVLADTLGGIPVEGWWKARVTAPREGPFNHPALANELCLSDPVRAHLYLAIGSLRRDPDADPTALIRTLGDVTFDDTELAALEIPVLFIVGTDDEIFPPDWIAAAASRVPNSRVETVAGAGHSPYFEQPEQWNSLVTEFWRRSP
jgi:pimeloyl-ACP methyl ester carboxylesterase